MAINIYSALVPAYLFLTIISFVGCSSSSQTTRSKKTKGGLTGTIVWKEGNFMPSIGKPNGGTSKFVKRVGTGYKTFDFYKFRSMRSGAETELDALSENNQYISDEEGNNGTFIKIKNDPRITWLGNFLRNTSIDELPQLYNVLIGDMSLVGNRPLPLYEAEMLTSNEWSMRFLGPAGLTGLWQISKRGKGKMSERERKQLDNFYAENHSFMMDMMILIKTIPAIIQKEKV